MARRTRNKSKQSLTDRVSSEKPGTVSSDETTKIPQPRARRNAAKSVKPVAAAKPASKPAAKTAAKTSRSSGVAASALEPSARQPATGKIPARSRRAKPAKATPEADTEENSAAAHAGHDAAPPTAAEAASAQKLAENIERIEALSHRLVAALTGRDAHDPGVEGPGADLYVTAANAWMKTLTEQPTRIIEQQVNFWGETLKNYAKAQYSLAKGQFTLPEENTPSDRRFKNPLWQSHPYFNFVKKQYLINAEAMRHAADGLELPDDTARRRVGWLTGQIIDMMAPTNFLATNPDALEKAIETEGESLVKGLENLVRDVERHGGEMIVSLADRDAFTVGENIGTAEGRVVHQTPLLELIQYNPTTDKVHETPLLIFPPWINKFYILDLKPQNSLIRWLVGQGHSLFVVSWKNPDTSYADVGLEDYVAAYLDAMDKVRDLTEQPKLNVVGYCIAGTTLSLTLALLNKRGDDRVNSASFFTTLTDFSDQGEFTTFLQHDFVDGIEAEIKKYGLLKAPLMSRTMSFLRANDLVWGPAIRSYMMGESPPAFDLLYWNGDSTNLPGKMAMQYLRGLCQANDFAGEGFELFGQKLRLADVQVPLCSVACESDHIAPWTDCWRGVAQMGSGDKTFILSESGHVAGIVNPPGRDKYGHYTGGKDFGNDPAGWRESARANKGSWWPSWGEWLSERSGKLIDARHPDEGLPPAPGSYVHEKSL